MSQLTDAYGEQFKKALRRAEKAMFTGRPMPKTPSMPCKYCGGRLSVQPRDHYSGAMSCEACGRDAGQLDLQAWDDNHRPEYERQLAAWDADDSIAP